MMKYLLPAIFSLFALASNAQEVCNSNGNLVIYSNYDGGFLNINVDVDIPNLHIGVLAYQATFVTITGEFAGNVQAVLYTGANEANLTCGFNNITTTEVFGVPAENVEVQLYPDVTIQDGLGAANMVCMYSCVADGGGCNSPLQVADYYLTYFPGVALHSHHTQYACWEDGTSFQISEGGNCCTQPTPGLVAAIESSATDICIGDCISFSDGTSGGPTQWQWTFNGGNYTSSDEQNPPAVCFENVGLYEITLDVSNEDTTITATLSISVSEVEYEVEITDEFISIIVDEISTTYLWVDCETGEELSTSFELPIADNPGQYLCIITQNGCTETTECFDITVSTENSADRNNVSIYPNPATDLLNVNLGRTPATSLAASIYNAAGMIVARQQVTGQEFTVDISQLPAGIYMLKLDGLSDENVLFVVRE